jgi:16S rRNA (cytidine1402-2'-O)-methyltransferase
MHSSSPTPESGSQTTPGALFVVSTPIGNLGDITLRALNTLKIVDAIAAEDTRHTRQLLTAHGIANTLISYHEHNEQKRTPELIDRLIRGQRIALVTNAGTPLISDPGYRLVLAAVNENIPVTPIPGVCAAVTALSVSGLPTDRFTFVGFPNRKKARRMEQLRELAHLPHVLVFYQAPRRLIPFMEELGETLGDRYAVVARELTKLHEEFLRGKLSEILAAIKQRDTVKGECTVAVSGAAPESGDPEEGLDAALEEALKHAEGPLSATAKALARQFGISRKTVYEKALRLRGDRAEKE